MNNIEQLYEQKVNILEDKVEDLSVITFVTIFYNINSL